MGHYPIPHGDYEWNVGTLGLPPYNPLGDQSPNPFFASRGFTQS